MEAVEVNNAQFFKIKSLDFKCFFDLCESGTKKIYVINSWKTKQNKKNRPTD